MDDRPCPWELHGSNAAKREPPTAATSDQQPGQLIALRQLVALPPHCVDMQWIIFQWSTRDAAVGLVLLLRQPDEGEL